MVKDNSRAESLSFPMRVVFYKEGEDFIAHCLEFDLVGHGSTQEAALELLSEAISIQVEETLQSGNSENLFSPAPGEFFRMFAAGKPSHHRAVGELNINFQNIEVTGIEQRDYIENDHHEDECVTVC